MSEQIKPTRRQALALMGAPCFLNPVQVLLQGLMQGLVQKAQAIELPKATKPRNFIYVNFSGGPARWMFDLPLKPYSNSGELVRNTHVNTRFRSDGRMEYATTLIQRGSTSLAMPTLWNSQLPTVAGGTVPMTKLLDHMLMIRGVNLHTDGHPSNNAKQIRPLSSAPSLTGAVADTSSRKAVPSVIVGPASGAGSAYKSAKGIGVVTSRLEGDTNPLTKILGPFDSSKDGVSSGYVSRREAMDAAVKSALTALGKYAESSQPGAKGLYTMRSEAESLLKTGIGDASSQYTSLLTKYQKLIKDCASATIPGVTDSAVSFSTFSASPNGIVNPTAFQTGGSYFYARNSDLTSIIQPATTMRYLAEGFAVTEYLIQNGYSNNVLFSTDAVINLRFEDYRSFDAPYVSLGDTTTGEWNLDEHYGGSATSLIVNSFMFHALSSCLYELISILKSANLFDETVIQIGSEFSRNPRDDESGSDHGFTASCTSVLSGVIASPLVVGNCLVDPSQVRAAEQTNSGSWGAAAKVKVDGAEQQLTIGHSTSTVAHLLRVKPLLPNNNSLVREGSGGITATVDLATNKTEG